MEKSPFRAGRSWGVFTGIPAPAAGTATGRGPVGPRPVVGRGCRGLWCAGPVLAQGTGARSAAGLQVDPELPELVPVGLRVVTAEQQLSTRGQHSPHLRGRSAPVTTVSGGQLGGGKGSWLHSGLPPSRLRETRSRLLRRPLARCVHSPRRSAPLHVFPPAWRERSRRPSWPTAGQAMVAPGDCSDSVDYV